MRCNDGSVKGFILPSIDIYPIISQPLGFNNISGFTGASYHTLQIMPFDNCMDRSDQHNATATLLC